MPQMPEFAAAEAELRRHIQAAVAAPARLDGASGG